MCPLLSRTIPVYKRHIYRESIYIPHFSDEMRTHASFVCAHVWRKLRYICIYISLHSGSMWTRSRGLLQVYTHIVLWRGRRYKYCTGDTER